MKNKLAKIISAVVAILMIATLIPVSAFAEDIPQPKSGGVYDGVYYDQLLIGEGTFYVGQKFGLYCGPDNANLNYQEDYTWEVRHASPVSIETELEGDCGDAYLTPYYDGDKLCYSLSPYSSSGAIYAGPYMRAYSPVAGTADIVCIWYDYYGNSYCIVNRLTFVESESTSRGTLELDVNETEEVVSAANVDGIALTNLASVTASSGNETVATVTNARVENGQVKYDINGISAGSTRITVTYTGTAHMGPSLYGEYSDVTFTITDIIDVTVNNPVVVEPNHYALTYDVNGADQPDTWTEAVDTEAESYEFEIVTTTPVREGYTFKGWADTPDATVAGYIGTDRITLTEAAPAKTIYAVWEQNPVDPDDPDKTSYPSIDKKIVLENGDLVDIASINKGDVVNFRLFSNVPQDLLNYLEPDPVDDPVHNPTRGFNNPINGGKYMLAFHDVMASELDFNEASVVVKIKDKVVPANLYELVVNPEDGCTFEVLMDLVAIYKAVDENGAPYFTEADFGTAEITVDYSATAADNLIAGEYLNEAWVEYEVASAVNSGNTDEDGESEHVIVKVYTCAVDVYKFDQANHENGLAGAKFILGTELSEDGIVGGTIIEGITDANGDLVFGGLKAGTYYLQETEAPEGYVCNSEVQTIVLDNTVANYTYTIDFANVLIPHTGGEGTLIFTMAGAAVMAVAVVAYVIFRRKNSKVEA